MSEISSKSNNINISNNIDISNNYGSTIASSSSNDNNIINSFINNVEEYDLFTENGVNTISQKKILETWHDFFAKTLKELQDTRDAINDELNGYINTDISDKYDYYSKKYPLLEIDNKIAYTLGGEYHFLSPDEFKLNHFGTTDDNNIGAYGDVLDYQALNVDFNEYTRQYNEFIKEISGTTYDEYKNKIAELDQDILSNKSAKYAVDQQLKEIPYLEKMQTDDYNNFVNNNINNIENIINGHRPVGNIHALGGYDNAIDLSNYDNYKEIMSNDDKCMYAYLLETEGVTVAEKYLDDIQDRLNQAKGAKEAEEFIRSISKNPDASYEDLVIDPTLWNGVKTTGKGFLDGIETFGEGIENIFATEGMMSDNQYAQMAILQKLNGQGVLSETYEISTSIGNMAVPTAISTIISIVATPAAGAAAAKILGATSMGISAAGNSKNDALVKGNTLFASTIYGVLNGVSETTLGYFLGNLPGLTKVSELSLRGMIREGAEEFIQEYVDAGARALVLGESINLDDIAPDALKSFLYGMITSGIMNGGQVGINATYNGAKYVFNNLNDLISFTDKFTSKTSSNNTEIKVKMSENNSSIMYEKQIINDIYFAINSHMSKYNCSFSEMIDILQRMIRDQNYLYLTNNNSARDIIRQYDFTQLSSAINNIILTNNNAVNDINFAINSLMQRQNCSYEDGLNAIKKIIDTNSFIYMTRYNNARNILMNYDISQLTLAYNTIIDNNVKKGLKSPIKFNNNRYNVLNTNLSDYFASFNNNSVGHNYGTDQGGIFELSYYQIDGTNIKLSYREIQDMIKRGDVIPHITKIGTNSYFELKEYIRYKYGFTDNEASIMMNCIDSTGACSYATVCNEIFSYFRANENDFERAFGYSMYTTDEFGNKILNSNKLLMDLYIFANTDVNGGSLLSSTPDGRVFYFNKNALSQNKDIFGRRQLDSEQQKYLSGIRGKNVDLINDFLNSRGYAYSSNIIARCANINNELISNINNRLNNGEGVSLGIYSSGSEIRMLSTDKNIMNSSTKTWGEGGGHSVFVTGMNSQGFIISSWGNEYIIPYADLNENARYIITSGNIYNIGR